MGGISSLPGEQAARLNKQVLYSKKDRIDIKRDKEDQKIFSQR